NGYMAKWYDQVLELLIDREVVLQEAQQIIERNQSIGDKLTKAAIEELDRKIEHIVAGNKFANIDELKEKMKDWYNFDSWRRLEVRAFIAAELLRSRIYPTVVKIGTKHACEYYDAHPEEFQAVDRINWQDIFIAVGAKHPTLEHARKVAEELLSRYRKGEK